MDLFRLERSDDIAIWKVPAEGGEAVATGAAGGYAVESLDGQELFFSGESLWRMDVNGGAKTFLAENVGLNPNFTVTEAGIYILTPHSKQLRFYSFTAKTTEHLFELPNSSYAGLSASPEGDTILFTQGPPPESDIMLVEAFR